MSQITDLYTKIQSRCKEVKTVKDYLEVSLYDQAYLDALQWVQHQIRLSEKRKWNKTYNEFKKEINNESI